MFASSLETLDPEPLLAERADWIDAETPTVLVAEDDRAVLAELADILRAQGYRVIEVVNALVFLDHLSAAIVGAGERSRLDLVIADVRMPGLATFGVLELLCEMHQAPAWICISPSRVSDETLRRIQALRPRALFQAPLDLDEIAATAVIQVPPPDLGAGPEADGDATPRANARRRPAYGHGARLRKAG